MPPAAATHQIVGETDRLNQVPHITSSKYIFNGVPDDKGLLKLKELDVFLNVKSNLLSNLVLENVTEPSAGTHRTHGTAALTSGPAKLTPALTKLTSRSDSPLQCCGPLFTIQSLPVT